MGQTNILRWRQLEQRVRYGVKARQKTKTRNVVLAFHDFTGLDGRCQKDIYQLTISIKQAMGSFDNEATPKKLVPIRECHIGGQKIF